MLEISSVTAAHLVAQQTPSGAASDVYHSHSHGIHCVGLLHALYRYYNMPSSDYYQAANKLQAYVDQYLATTVVASADEQ